MEGLKLIDMTAQNFPELKNDLFLRALKGEEVERPPVWMMRQAGRYLPQYMVLRKKYTFFERVENPELACEITLQPIDELEPEDRKSTRLNSSHVANSYAVFCLKKKINLIDMNCLVVD